MCFFSKPKPAPIVTAAKEPEPLPKIAAAASASKGTGEDVRSLRIGTAANRKQNAISTSSGGVGLTT